MRFTATVDVPAQRRRRGDARDRRSYARRFLPTARSSRRSDDDPDYLTILNQPFSVAARRADAARPAQLGGAVPFDFPSPMTGAPLHGSLRRLPDGTLGGKRVLGIAFVAHGPLNGALPDRPETALSGTITMNGHRVLRLRRRSAAWRSTRRSRSTGTVADSGTQRPGDDRLQTDDPPALTLTAGLTAGPARPGKIEHSFRNCETAARCERG